MARPKPNPAQMREQILAKANQIIQKKGFESLTMKALATDVGVSVGKIYAFFSGKDAIFLELEIQFFEELIRSTQQALNQALSPVERLQQALQHHYAYASHHLDLYKLVTSPPKVFSHYIGTDFEPLAKQELNVALESINLLREGLIQALPNTIQTDSDAVQQRYLFLVNAMHGLIVNSHSPIFPYISNSSNTLIDNQYQQPAKDNIIQQQINIIVQAAIR